MKTECHHCRYSFDAAGVNSVPPLNRLITQHQLKDHHKWIVLQHNNDHAL
jgi:hypothetical protein